MKLFQAAVGFPQDGNASSVLLALLYSDSAPRYGSSSSTTPDDGQYETLSVGSKGAKVLRLQQRLIELGWLTGTADGDYGENTARAVKAYQYQIGQAQTGLANVELQQRLFAGDARAYVEYKELKEGDIGEDVLNIQLRLIELGFLDDTEANTDGEFGPNLKNAVTLLQTAMGLAPIDCDGIADVEFQTFLFSDNALVYRMIG